MPFPLRRPVHDGLVYVPTVASTAYEPGDLLYINSGDAYPASSQVDQTTEAANQAVFADNFLGICNGQKLASDGGVGEIAVSVDGEFLLTCESSTFEVGEFVAAAEAASGTALENQEVKKTATRADAIGVVTKQYAAATTEVWVRLWSHFNKPLTPGT